LRITWPAALLCAATAALAAERRGPIRERIRERIVEKQRVNDTGNPEASLVVGGRKRTYLMHLPKGDDGKTPLPLVVVFHGGGGNAQNAVRMTGMDEKADEERFIAVYPNGTGPTEGAFLTWNAWNCCGPALDDRVDDVAFVRALVEKLQREHNVDQKRIYATGLSNGGMMTHRVGCELSDVFAAIAPVAGALNTDECRPDHPVSVVIFHGTADNHVRYEGGEPLETVDRRHPRVDRPVSYAVASWVKHDRCQTEPVHSKEGHVIHDVHADGTDGAAVELYAVEGQGHAWPGGKKGRAHGNVDAPTSEISATDRMWEFFARHPKK
jgi:polyhydroxybutyrate depolymerase